MIKPHAGVRCPPSCRAKRAANAPQPARRRRRCGSTRRSRAPQPMRAILGGMND